MSPRILILGAKSASIHRGIDMKSNVVRFTVAVSLLATMALTLAAGLKW